VTSPDERSEEFEQNSESVRITDRRRIDPETGAVRPPAGGVPGATAAGSASAAGAPTGSAEVPVDPAADPTDPATRPTSAAPRADDDDGVAVTDAAELVVAQAQVAELTEDLQRLAAEYKNYRDRTQRELAEAKLRGRVEVISALLETLDDIDRARSHGELDGPVKAMADNLVAALTKLKVESFGAVDDPFDPAIHEAMTHAEGEGLSQPICSAIYQPGYRLGDRIIRPARVGVTE
jgi:molecular chaperone GrpE